MAADHVSLVTAAQTTSYTREVLPMDPGRGHDWGLLHSTFNNRLHDDNEEAHAFGMDDVEPDYSGKCSDKYVIG
jgi:hypothetical protein